MFYDVVSRLKLYVLYFLCCTWTLEATYIFRGKWKHKTCIRNIRYCIHIHSLTQCPCLPKQRIKHTCTFQNNASKREIPFAMKKIFRNFITLKMLLYTIKEIWMLTAVPKRKTYSNFLWHKVSIYLFPFARLSHLSFCSGFSWVIYSI